MPNKKYRQTLSSDNKPAIASSKAINFGCLDNNTLFGNYGLIMARTVTSVCNAGSSLAGVNYFLCVLAHYGWEIK